MSDENPRAGKECTFQVLENVAGYGERRNTLLLGPDPLNWRGVGSHKPVETVVFFPGDVQNFQSVMKHHPSNMKWRDWTFENTMDLLQKRFPLAQIILVTPARRVDETFSCYDNFMEMDILGSPVRWENHNAWEHLCLLLEAAWQSLGEESHSSTKDEEGSSHSQNVFTNSPVTLVGFSKGCTVLNQLMYELKDARASPKLLTLIRRVNALYWLDGGHAGPAGVVSTYVTDESVVREVANLQATIHVHVTPYQVSDEARRHIGEEHSTFVGLLMAMGADLKHVRHFPDETRSLRNHFEVLKLF